MKIDKSLNGNLMIANFTILLPSAYFIGFLLIIQHCCLLNCYRFVIIL